MKLHHVIEAQQFDSDTLSNLFRVAGEMEELAATGSSDLLHGKTMASLFYEPSTRTRFSFEAAMTKLGGKVITTENAREFSSVAKGETLEDTIRIVESYVDVIVLRHFESGAATRAARIAQVPIINAGDGPGQHPTQALLDLYTIQKEKGRLDNLSVALVGDLSNGRAVRSLAYLLGKYDNITFYFVAPDVVKMKDDIKDYLTRHNVRYIEETNLKKVLPKVDVVYQTRIQKERFGDRIDDYEKARGIYIIDREMLSYMHDDAIIMHPLPRVDEITPDVDNDPRAAYFRQAKNGLYIRMALLTMVLIG
ncbi:MAG: aspartate carbamoyltransferase [Candidatus Latescibacteria bacterium]|nr:aspartate carbamoyltransferase [Candidatus Latescibacterota bacterium]